LDAVSQFAPTAERRMIMVKCNQICPWNYYEIGCKKPNDELCPMSNLATKEKPQTNADRIRAMSDEALADFFFESPEIEFTVCEYCQYFGGHISDTPCKHDMGRCFISAKNEAFKKWLKQPAE
jgi:hypothetical protein